MGKGAEQYNQTIRLAIDVFPFYTQCFLMLGISLERWIIVCRASEASSILRAPNKIFLYVTVSAVATLIPLLIMTDFYVFRVASYTHFGFKYDSSSASFLSFMK